MPCLRFHASSRVGKMLWARFVTLSCRLEFWGGVDMGSLQVLLTRSESFHSLCKAGPGWGGLQ